MRRKLFDTNCEPSPITGIQIDSRACAPGDLFVALPGTTKDGHDFIKDAETANAGACLVSRPSSETKIAQVVVDDSLRGLNRLAKKARARFRGKMVGITGSVGKTGCKEMLFIYYQICLTHANKDSFNNHRCSTQFAALPLNHDFAVQEMGMNAPGEIATLTRIVSTFITRIANTHSGFFETLDSRIGKSEIFQGLKSGGIAVLNKDDKFYEKLRNWHWIRASKVINSDGQNISSA